MQKCMLKFPKIFLTKVKTLVCGSVKFEMPEKKIKNQVRYIGKVYIYLFIFNKKAFKNLTIYPPC